MGKQKPVLFRASIPPNTEKTFKYRIPKAGSIDKVTIRFYSGPQGDFQITPLLVNYNDQRQPIIQYAEGSNKFVAGDNDIFEFPTSIPVDVDDEIHVIAKNVETVYSYDLVVDFIVTEGEKHGKSTV
jgi:hypothetical protein